MSNSKKIISGILSATFLSIGFVSLISNDAHSMMNIRNALTSFKDKVFGTSTATTSLNKQMSASRYGIHTKEETSLLNPIKESVHYDVRQALIDKAVQKDLSSKHIYYGRKIIDRY